MTIDDSVSKPPPLPQVIPVVPGPDRGESLGLPLTIADTVALVLLTVLADVCLYGTAGGLGGAVLLMAVFAGLHILRGRVARRQALLASAAVVAIAGVTVWYAWWLTAVAAVVAILVIAVRLWRPEWSFLESLWASVWTVVNSMNRLYGHLVAHRLRSAEKGNKGIAGKIIVIPLAVSILFLVIFSAANPVVADAFSRVWSRLGDWLSNLGDYLSFWRAMFWLGSALVFAALIRPLIRSVAIDKLMSLDLNLVPRDIEEEDRVNFQAAFMTLVCVNVVFLGYNAMDSVYLYFKATLPAGIYWTAYTHQGCGWLTLALLVSSVVLGVVFWGQHNFHPRSGQLKLLAYIWIAQNAVLAVGTLRRIGMYIDFSGLTHLLLTGIYGAVLVMAGIVIMAIKVRDNRNAVWMLRRYVAAFAVAITVLALTPQGVVCARYNVARVLEHKPHAMWPLVLKDLQPDALPYLIPLLDYTDPGENKAKEKLVREGVAAILGMKLAKLEHEREVLSWSQWQASSWWAVQNLRPVKERLYQIAAPSQWNSASQRLRADYDLTGNPNGTP